MDLTGLPPLCIHAGDHEILLSDATRLAGRARAARVTVELTIWPGMWHVFQTAARLVPEARQSIEGIGGFVSRMTRFS
jgi:acetyl esterase/lipase